LSNQLIRFLTTDNCTDSVPPHEPQSSYEAGQSSGHFEASRQTDCHSLATASAFNQTSGQPE
jgi:hypothetical protein